jgi:hypothetical protein
MLSINYNLALLEEMMAEFEDYLLSQELFWPLQKRSYERTPFPRLSLGSLILTLDELSAQESSMDAKQGEHYRQLLEKFKNLSQSKQAAIEKKAAREVKTRITLWDAFLQDLEEDPESVVEYDQQVRNRVLMTKLRALTGEDSSKAEADRIEEMDQQVAEMAESVDFLWDDRLMPIYPISTFPYLYIRPRQGK